MDKTINICIVDDELLIVELLSQFFSSVKQINMLLKSPSGEEILKELEQIKTLPDVIIIDFRMKEINGIETIKIINNKYPSIKTIMMTSHYKISYIGSILQSGANAFLPKDVDPSILLEVIKEVHEKGQYFSQNQIQTLKNQIANNIPNPPNKEINSLTKRELEVLKLICQQKTTKEIGENLFIAPRTVEGHRGNLFLKTQTKNIAGLVIYAIQNSIINLEELLLE